MLSSVTYLRNRIKPWLLIAITTLGCLCEGTELRGWVHAEHREGAPLSGVKIRIGEHQTITDGDGAFTLKLTSANSMPLQLDKRGWQAIYSQPPIIAPTHSTGSLIHLVMTDQERTRNARYLHILSVLREISSQELAERLEGAERHTTGRENWTVPVLMSLPNTAWILSGDPLSQNDVAAQKALNAIDLGHADAARTTIKQAVFAHPLLDAMLKFAVMEFSLAEQTLAKATGNTNDYRVPYTLALFLSLQNRHKEAAPLLEKVRGMNPPAHIQAMVSAHLATITLHDSQLKNVSAHALRAVKQCRDLYAENDAIAALLAANQILYAAHLPFSDAPERTKEEFALALKVTGLLRPFPRYKTDPYYTNPFALGIIGTFLEDLYYTKPHGPEQITALDMHQALVQLLPAVAREQLCEYFFRQNSIPAYHSVSSEILAGLASRSSADPTRILHHFAAHVALKTGERFPPRFNLIPQAMTFFKSAESASRPNLSYVNNDAKVLIYTRALNGLARLHMEQSEVRQAAEHLKKVGIIIHANQQLLERDTGPIITESYYTQARLAEAQSAFPEAEKWLRQAMNLQQAFRTQPTAANEHLRIRILHLWGRVQQNTAKYDNALIQFTENFQLIDQLTLLEAEDRKMYKAWSMHGRAKCNAAMRRTTELRGDVERLIPITESLYKTNPARFLDEYVKARVVQAVYHNMMNDYEEAHTYLMDALEKVDKTPHLNPEKIETTAAALDHATGTYYLDQRQTQRAFVHIDRSIKRLLPWYEANPPAYQLTLINYSLSLVSTLNMQQKYQQAGVVIDHAKKLLAESTGNASPPQQQKIMALRERIARIEQPAKRAAHTNFERMLQRAFSPKRQ